MKRATTDYTGIAACHNDKCPSHTSCLRWQIGQRNPDIIDHAIEQGENCKFKVRIDIEY